MIRVKAHLLAASFIAAARNDIRYYLNGVSVEPMEEGCLLVSTDGHRLLVIYDKDGFCTEPEIVSLPALMHAQIKRADAFTIELNKGMAKLKTKQKKDKVESYSLTTPYIVIDANYPDWRKVIPSDKKLVSHDCSVFNPLYVKDLHLISKYTFNGNWPYVKMFSEKKSKTTLCEVSDCALYVLMELNIENSDTFIVPSWARNKQP